MERGDQAKENLCGQLRGRLRARCQLWVAADGAAGSRMDSFRLTFPVRVQKQAKWI